MAQTDTVGEVIMSSPPPKEDACKGRKFILTINNFTEQDKNQLLLLCKEAKAYVVGDEIAPTTGTRHLQCYVRFDNARYRTAIKKFLKKDCFIAIANGTDLQNFNYCKKENLLETNIKFKLPPRVIPSLQYEELYDWQKSIFDFIQIPLTKSGQIIWIYESEGRVGKTELAKFLMDKYDFKVVYGGKCRDIINLVSNNKKYFIEEQITGLIYNLSRSDDMEKISYKSMEQVSDGIISNSKYESCCFKIPPAHIIVFSNQPPILNQMTLSRWDVYTIENLKLKKLSINDLHIRIELRPTGAQAG